MTDDFDPAFWDEHYRARAAHADPGADTGHGAGHGAQTGHGAGPHLPAELQDLAPGTALDAGCGEGAASIWLAEHGWRVTGVDVSPTALDRARERAESLREDVRSRISWREADLTDGMAGDERFDLVSSQYVHVPASARERLLHRLAAAVAPGGTLLFVGHHPSDLDPARAHGSSPERHITPEEVVATLDPESWDVVVAEARPVETADPHEACAGAAARHRNEAPILETVVRARRHR